MIRLKQRFRHDPENGVFGDCHRTALACLLNLELDEVPHFYQLKIEAELRAEPFVWRAEVEKFLNTQGLTQADVVFGGTLEQLFAFMAEWNPQTFYLLGGVSPRRVNHTVICRGGCFEWDTHPDDGFIVGPLDTGTYEITFLLPISMRATPGGKPEILEVDRC